MKKVILKYGIKDADLFENKLDEVGLDLSPIYWQHDRVYVPRGYKRGMNYPRMVMRTEMRAVDEPPKYTLILKRHIEDSGVDIIEETPVSDYLNMVNIIFQLGFKLAGEVSRRRQDVKISEGTYIYLDQVENQPGCFVKIESGILDDESVSEVRRDLQGTLASFGARDLVESAYFEYNKEK